MTPAEGNRALNHLVQTTLNRVSAVGGFDLTWA